MTQPVMTRLGHDPKNKLVHDRDPGRVKVPEYLLYIFRNSVMTRARVMTQYGRDPNFWIGS